MNRNSGRIHPAEKAGFAEGDPKYCPKCRAPWVWGNDFCVQCGYFLCFARTKPDTRTYPGALIGKGVLRLGVVQLSSTRATQSCAAGRIPS